MTILSSKESKGLIELLDSTSNDDRKLAKNILKASNKTLFLMDTFKRTLLCSILFIGYCILAVKYCDPVPKDVEMTGELFCWLAGGALTILNSILYISRGEKLEKR